MLQIIIFVLVVDVVAVDSENDSYFPPVAEKQCVKANSKGIKFTPSYLQCWPGVSVRQNCKSSLEGKQKLE